MAGPQAEEFDRLRQQAENQEGVAVRMTWAEQMKAEGLEEGRREGQSEGLAKGVEALRSVVLLQLEQRFGVVPKTAKRKLEKISSLEPLTHLAERVVVASSLKELGL